MSQLTPPQIDALRESLLEELNDYRQATVTLDTRFSELAFDSLDRIDLILEIEKTCDCTIDDAMLSGSLTTVGDFHQALCHHATFP